MVIPLEEQILSLFSSGIYITNKELVDIGESLGISLPLKSKEILLGKIINFANSDEKRREKLVNLLLESISSRLEQYSVLIGNYPEGKELIEPLITQGNELKKRLKEELN